MIIHSILVHLLARQGVDFFKWVFSLVYSVFGFFLNLKKKFIKFINSINIDYYCINNINMLKVMKPIAVYLDIQQGNKTKIANVF